MRLRLSCYWLCAMVSMLFPGCENHPETVAPRPTSNTVAYQAPPKACGIPELVDVRSEAGRSIGVFEVMNDSTHLYLIYSPPLGMTLQDISIFYGREKDLPLDASGSMDAMAFPLNYKGLKQTGPWTARIAWMDLPSCVFVAAKIKVANADSHYEGWAGNMDGKSSIQGLSYCRQACRVSIANCSLHETAKQPITIMQDQWSSEAGKASAGLLRKQFSRLFPKGLTVGCDKKVEFGSADAILKALPLMGPAEVLEASPKPGSVPKNRLAGELISLILMLEMDAQLPEFSPGSPALKDLQVATGAFEGWNVAEVSQEANSVFGGCTSNYTPAQIYEVVQDINQSFAQGRYNRAFLRCPGE